MDDSILICSKDANNRVLGPRYIWDLKPCYLGPWTLRGIHEGEHLEVCHASHAALQITGPEYGHGLLVPMLLTSAAQRVQRPE